MNGITETALLVGVTGVLITVIAWIGTRLHARMDAVEEKVGNAVTREELATVINSMREENKTAHEATTTRLDQIWKHLAK